MLSSLKMLFIIMIISEINKYIILNKKNLYTYIHL